MSFFGVEEVLYQDDINNDESERSLPPLNEEISPSESKNFQNIVNNQQNQKQPKKFPKQKLIRKNIPGWTG